MDNHEAQYIYRASIRLRNGKRLVASQFGLKAFRIRLKHGHPEQPRLPGL